MLIEPQGKCSLGTNQKCYVKLLPAEEKFVFSEKYLTYRLSEKMAIIPVERRFTSGVSTLKWHTRWSRKIHEEDSDDQVSENEGEEPPNWASGFIVFKVNTCSYPKYKLFLGRPTKSPHRSSTYRQDPQETIPLLGLYFRR